MSRHSIAGKEPGYQIDLGYDNPLQTFFAQVWGPVVETDEEEEPEPVLWVGTTPQAIKSIADLETAIAAYGTLTPALRVQLYEDLVASPGPSQLQRAMWQWMGIEV